MNVKSALKGKIFGMPRWLFFSLLLGGVAVGIYLRRRNIANADTDPDNQVDAEAYGGDEPVGEMPEGEPGLAGVGVASPPGGVYPVTTPYIPEGLTEIIGTLTGGLVDVATVEPPNAVDVPAGVAPPPATPATGGGAPKRRPHTTPKPLTKAERTRRVASIQRRHGAKSPAAKRAAQRLHVPLPKPRKKAKRR